MKYDKDRTPLTHDRNVQHSLESYWKGYLKTNGLEYYTASLKCCLALSPQGTCDMIILFECNVEVQKIDVKGMLVNVFKEMGEHASSITPLMDVGKANRAFNKPDVFYIVIISQDDEEENAILQENKSVVALDFVQNGSDANALIALWLQKKMDFYEACAQLEKPHNLFDVVNLQYHSLNYDHDLLVQFISSQLYNENPYGIYYRESEVVNQGTSDNKHLSFPKFCAQNDIPKYIKNGKMCIVIESFVTFFAAIKNRSQNFVQILYKFCLFHQKSELKYTMEITMNGKNYSCRSLCKEFADQMRICSGAPNSCYQKWIFGNSEKKPVQMHNFHYRFDHLIFSIHFVLSNIVEMCSLHSFDESHDKHSPSFFLLHVLTNMVALKNMSNSNFMDYGFTSMFACLYNLLGLSIASTDIYQHFVMEYKSANNIEPPNDVYEYFFKASESLTNNCNQLLNTSNSESGGFEIFYCWMQSLFSFYKIIVCILTSSDIDNIFEQTNQEGGSVRDTCQRIKHVGLSTQCEMELMLLKQL